VGAAKNTRNAAADSVQHEKTAITTLTAVFAAKKNVSD
jgi:hypothetical protein